MIVGVCGGKVKGTRTEGEAVVAERLPEDAVELPHLPQSGRGPAVCRDGRLDLFSQGHEEMGLLREVVERVGDGLNGEGEGGFKLLWGSAGDDNRTHHRRRLDGGKVDAQEPLCEEER